MATEISQAVLLVGGEGTRLRPLTYRRPKALVPLLNEPLLSYEFRLLARCGITDVILAVGYRADSLRESLGDGSRWGVRLTYVEDPQPLGTAGGIKNVGKLLRGDFVAMNGDLVYDVDLGAVLEAHADFGATVTYCLRRVDDVSRYGLIRCDDYGRVQAFLEKRAVDETGRNTVNSGLYVMSPEVLDFIPAATTYSNELELFPGLLKAGRPLLGYVPAHQGYWADVGTLDSYLETSCDLLGGAVPWVPATVADDAVVEASARLVGPVHLGPGVQVGPGAVIGPDVTLGPNCTVGAGARICRSLLWEQVTVGAGAGLQNVVIADNVTLPERANHNGGVICP